MFGMMALLLLIADEFHLEEAFGNLGPWSAALIFGTAGISWGSEYSREYSALTAWRVTLPLPNHGFPPQACTTASTRRTSSRWSWAL